MNGHLGYDVAQPYQRTARTSVQYGSHAQEEPDAPFCGERQPAMTRRSQEISYRQAGSGNGEFSSR